ncbi:DUF3429 domain-containing protein [uncultured Sphingomonas sp.]|uniref:DUF3429 domain-containing protein n=1 Tax=uncultured Sphingomonas sp. TaxID=158754 RepID=UPI0035C958B4
MPPAAIARTTRLLGFAGLLPQLVAAALVASGRGEPFFFGRVLALVYGIIILSFLGGVWWGFAVRRTTGQGALAAIAVLPSLAGVALMIATQFGLPLPRALVTLGTLIALTPVVDRRLVATGEAPAGWMRLRAPLSLGLGGLTILAGLLAL